MNSLKKILIIGSGQAAIYAASEFRKYDKDSTVTIFGNENYHPYERPPLSKEFLMNKKKEDEDFDKAAEDLRLATRHLGMIVGKVDVEEILGSIFNDFCIGK